MVIAILCTNLTLLLSGRISILGIALSSWLRQTIAKCSRTVVDEVEVEVSEVALSQGTEGQAPSPQRRSRRQASQVSQGTTSHQTTADDLPAVSTGRALSALQAASALQATSAQPATSQPTSRLVSQTISAAGTPPASHGRYATSPTPPPPLLLERIFSRAPVTT